ncbi:MAG: ferredoxin, partial [Candidatus Omnitrophica bacterium]|nr:ferredoxin [Candidatus Omnitrophota bacterium]
MTETIYKDGIKAAVSLITIAGRTAPKAKGMDTIIIKILTSAELKKLIKKMKEIGKTRDAKGISMSDAVILVGA